ncbi:hypothetical protein Tco_1167448 [Tanacetum coccineum]
MQSSDGRFFRRNTSSPWSKRSSSNYGESRKKKDRMRILSAVGSTIHSMIKFPTNQGIVIMETSRETLWECRQLERVQGHVPLSGGRGRASIDNGISVQMFPTTSEGIQPNKDDRGRRRKDWVSYGGRSVMFHPYAERIKELSCYTSEDDGRDVEETLRKLKRVNIKIDPATSSFGVKEGRFLGFMVTKEGIRADPEKEDEILMLCLRQKDKTISSVLLVEKEGIKILVSYVSRPLQGMEICYTPIEKMVEAEGSVVKKFFGQGEQVEETPDANEGGTLNLSRKLQEKSTPTPRAWRLYLGREKIEEGSGVGIILVSLKEKMYSHAIRLKFNASNHVMDYEALLVGLAASVSKGLATVKLEFLNQEVSVGIKTRPSVEETSNSKKGKAASNVPGAKPNYNWEASGSN